VLAGLLLLPGLAAAATAVGRTRRVALAAGAVVVLGATAAAFPSNTRLWAYLHSAGPGSEFALVEDRACVNALKDIKGEDLLFINATSQNGHPFDDFHVLIGLLPALLHGAPERAVAVGLGIGATPYGMSRDRRVRRLDVVEICGGEVGLQRVLAHRGAVESQRLLAEERVDIHVGDGRKFLLGTDERFDVVTVDVVRPQSAYSGSLYSVEFYELLRSRLQPGGLLSQWIPTPRALNSVTEVFPYVMSFTVASYNGSQFFVASSAPITFDRDAVLARFRNLVSESFTPNQTRSIEEFLSTVEPTPIVAGGAPPPVVAGGLNRDLMPRDEYFLNNPLTVPARTAP
jgi:spermidine synthase